MHLWVILFIALDGLWAQSILANPSLHDTQEIASWVSKFPTMEALNPIARLKRSDITQFALNTEKKSEYCSLFRDQWDAFFKLMQAAPPRSQVYHRALLNSFALRSELCQTTISEFKDMFLASYQNTQMAKEQWLWPQTLVQLLPSSSSGIDFSKPSDEAKMNANTFSQWLLPELKKTLKQKPCVIDNDTLPTSECMSVWMFQKLSEQDFFPKDQSINIDLSFVFEDLELQSLPPLFSELISKQASLKSQFTSWMLEKQKPQSLQGLWKNQASLVFPLLQWDSPSFSSEFCLSWWQHLRETWKTENSGNKSVVDPSYLALLAHTSNRCQIPDSEQTQLWQTLKTQVTMLSKISEFGDISLENIREHIFDEDLQLRKLLNLKFYYGSAFDLEDIHNQHDDISSEALDSLIVNHLHRSSLAPWLKIVENIEDHDIRASKVRDMLWGLGQDIIKGKTLRAIQIAYLQEFDFGDEKQAGLIADIRRISTSIIGEEPRFHPITFEVHNHLQKSLIAKIHDFLNEHRNISERTRSRILELLEKVDHFFNKNLGAQAFRDIQDNLHQNCKQNSLQALLKKIHGLKLDTPVLFSQTLDLHKEISAFEKNALNPNENLKMCYLDIMRMTSILHQIFLQQLGSGEMRSLQEKDIRQYLTFYYSLQEPSSDFGSQVRLIQSQLKHKFQDRLKLFHWFLSSQNLRDIHNEEYYSSNAQRLFALPLFSELFIRESGLPFWDVFSTSVEQRILNKGQAIGRLIFVPKEELKHYSYNPRDILITDTLPDNLGVTAALITEVFQPFGSHADLRTKERNTPNIFVKNAHTQWSEYLNKVVKLEVSDSTVLIKVASQDDLKQLQKQVPAIVIPTPNLSLMQTIDLDSDKSSHTISQIGAKAFGYALLRKTFGPKSYTPKGIAIPFGIYHYWLKKYGIDKEIEDLLLEKDKLDLKILESRLSLIRSHVKAIANHSEFLESAWYQTLQKELLQLQRSTIDQGHSFEWSDQNCFRFRSSTNSEDLMGFTGAGLYDSASGCLKTSTAIKTRSVAEAITKVWGSLWSNRAFGEREFYGMDHLKVASSVLIHRNYPNESSNGVLLTSSLLENAHHVTVHRGDDLVTTGAGGLVGDEYEVQNQDPLKWIRRSLAIKDHAILSNSTLGELLNAGEKLQQALRREFATMPNLAILKADIEFKTQHRTGKPDVLYIKQVRPFTHGF